MRRAIVFAVLAAAASIAAYWLALHPGQVSIQWLGYRLEPPIGLLVLAVLAFAVVVILLYRIIRAILGTPRRIGRARADSRRRRGYKALSQGMVAVAAGDAQEAQRWSRRADDLLEDPPITLLLAAQAAQLNGDEKAAEKYFNAMLDKPETRFLGLRGLLMQALRGGDHQRALGYVRQAHALRPKTPWVVTNLFELSQRSGDLDAAAAALKQAVKIKAMDKAEADHKGAVITLAKAEHLLAEGQKEEAFTQARLADRSDPDLLAAALLHARLAVERKAWKEAAKVVERSWLWGEARRHLAELVALAGEDPPRAQVCRLMARLEEAERHDIAAARRWLERAAAAPPDPAWVCDGCGAVATRWSANCGSCSSFDSLDWRLPRRVGVLAATGGEDLARIAFKAPPPADSTGEGALPRLPAVTPLPGPPDRVKPIAKPEGEGDGPQRPKPGEPAAQADEDDDDSEAAAVEGYVPPRPTS